MRVHVLFFGSLKEIVGRSEEDTDVGAAASLEDLFARYTQNYPELAGFRSSVVASVNQVFSDWQTRLNAGDEVAFLPPVSGGEGRSAAELPPNARDLIELVREPIRAAEISKRLKAPEDGAVLVFEGIVRNHFEGRQTLYLDYEAYETMALAKLREIAAAMHGQFHADHVALVHRLGRLAIGETSVLVGVASAHRGAAFEACRFGIDTLKRTVPIWKKEHFDGGAVWAKGEIPPLPSNSGQTESIR